MREAADKCGQLPVSVTSRTDYWLLVVTKW